MAILNKHSMIAVHRKHNMDFPLWIVACDIAITLSLHESQYKSILRDLFSKI
jgi:hypothetical protein